MEAVPRMPMIWLDLKEAGEFAFNAAVKKSAVNVPRDFEGCSTLRKYFGQLHYLQSRIPMGAEQEAAVPIAWTEIFSGKTVTHEDIKYEQACILYNLGALHSMLGAMDKRVSEECAAGAFTYLRDHFPHSYSVDMSHQILSLNINLMLGQAQECLLEKSMLDNRKSFLVARISAQVVDYYKEACRALENSETASLLGKIQKDWKKLVQMKIYYFAAVAHLHMGKQAEEQQKFGERVIYFQSALDKLNEAIKLAKVRSCSICYSMEFSLFTALKDFFFLLFFSPQRGEGQTAERCDGKDRSQERSAGPVHGLDAAGPRNRGQPGHVQPHPPRPDGEVRRAQRAPRHRQEPRPVHAGALRGLHRCGSFLEGDPRPPRGGRGSGAEAAGASWEGPSAPGVPPGAGRGQQGVLQVRGGAREGQLHQHRAPQSHEPPHWQPPPAQRAAGAGPGRSALTCPDRR
ncbi:unnamed protein product [Bubo scandiacus]